MLLINCKTELKLKWVKRVLAASGNDNTIPNDNDIIFTNKYTKLSVHVVILLVKNNQKLSKLLSKGIERSVYWKSYKTKS